MDISTKDKPNYEKEIIFSLTPSEMEKYLDNAARSLSKDMKIKGFREGKMPRSVVEGALGRERVWRKAANEAVEKSYVAAIAERKLEAVGRPRIEILKLVPGNNFEFKATIPLSPNIELPDYSAIARTNQKKEKEEVKVEDKEIDESLKWLQKSRDQQAKNSSQSKIDDEFARSLGNFENLEALKKNLRDGIKLEKEKKQKDVVRLKIMEEIARKANVEVSEILIENELDKMQEEFTEQISQMGLTMEKYLEQISQKDAPARSDSETMREEGEPSPPASPSERDEASERTSRGGKTISDLRSGWRRLAREKVTTSLLLRAIADKEHIEPSDEEITNEANKYLERFKNIKEVKKKLDSSLLKLYIRDMLRNEKVFEFLKNCK